MDKLAINGGAPVRTTPFPPKYLGASMIDGNELKELTDDNNDQVQNEIIAMERDRITTNYNEHTFALLKAVASNDVDEVRTLIIQDECKANTYVTQQ